MMRHPEHPTTFRHGFVTGLARATILWRVLAVLMVAGTGARAHSARRFRWTAVGNSRKV